MGHQPKEPRLPRIIEEELNGADWRWQHGKKHWKLIVNGRMAGIWPKKGSRSADQATFNTRSQIRQALKKAS